MADRILKPDSGNDLVLQNDDGSGKIEINENASIAVTGSFDVSGGGLTTSTTQKQEIVQAGPGSGTLDVSSGTFTTSSAQKQAIVQAGPGSGTLDVSSGTFTTSTAQKDAIVDGSTAISRSGNNLTFAGTVATGAGITIPNDSTIGSASDTDAISISSGGYVIHSARPYFWVRGDHGSEDIGSNNRFPFNQISTDNGNHWNTTGYYFTTPVAGLYFFTAQLYWYNNVDSIDVEIDSSDTSDSNLVSLGRIIYDPRASDMIFHVRALCYLSANRRVSVRNKAGGNRSWYFNDAGRHTSFQGCLIG